jgi:general secretion pathway protein D
VIALIPHIVRGPDVTASNLKSVATGNIAQIKVGRAPRVMTPDDKLQSNNIVATSASAGPPATAPPVPGPPPATAPPVATAPAPPVPVTGPAHITFIPPAADAQLNSTVTITVAGDNITDMVSAAAQLRFDPRILRINNIVAGDLPQRGLPQPALEPSKNILNDSGQADMSISRGPTVGGISGAGGLFTVVFQAVGRGNTTVSVASVSLTASTGQPIAANAPPPLVVNVQ